MKIQRTRSIPHFSQLKVAVGDLVKPRDPIAEAKYLPGDLYKISVTDRLKISNESIVDYVTVAAGDYVHRGQVVAALHRMWDSLLLHSPFSGYVESISPILGEVWVRDVLRGVSPEPMVFELNTFGLPKLNLESGLKVSPGQRVSKGQDLFRSGKCRHVAPCPGVVDCATLERVVLRPIIPKHAVLAYVQGQVVKVDNETAVTIEGECQSLRGVYGVGNEAVGELALLSSSGDLRPEHKGKITAFTTPLSLQALQALTEIGVAGIIAPATSFNAVCCYAGPEHIPGITGNENVPAPLVLTQGFKNQPMSSECQGILARFEGRVISIDATTQIRAGAIRPEILLWR